MLWPILANLFLANPFLSCAVLWLVGLAKIGLAQIGQIRMAKTGLAEVGNLFEDDLFGKKRGTTCFEQTSARLSSRFRRLE